MNTEIERAQAVALASLGQIDCPDEYKITLMFLVYRTVLLNPNITLKSVRWILDRHGVDKSYVDKVLGVLASKDTFGNGLTLWANRTTKIKHYVANQSSELMKDWIAYVINDRPELEHFDLTKNGK